MLSRRLRTRVTELIGRRRGPVVLLYHRVAKTATDPQLLTVTPAHFAEHLELLRTRFRPLSLADLVAATRENRACADAVAVTFDDGYADNLLAARPLLEREDVPATAFVPSGYVGSNRPFWWDELAQLLLEPGRLPSSVSLQIGDRSLDWDVGEDSDYAAAHAASRSRWSVLDRIDPGPRQALYRRLCTELRALDERMREDVLGQLRSVVDRRDASVDDVPRPLTREEVLRLGHDGLVEIGAHTNTHPVLAGLASDRQRAEIAGSKSELEDLVGRPVRSLAYPYGGPADFDATSVASAREAGFEYACSSITGRLGRKIDRLRIPRMAVRDWNGDELSRHLGELGR